MSDALLCNRSLRAKTIEPANTRMCCALLLRRDDRDTFHAGISCARKLFLGAPASRCSGYNLESESGDLQRPCCCGFVAEWHSAMLNANRFGHRFSQVFFSFWFSFVVASFALSFLTSRVNLYLLFFFCTIFIVSFCFEYTWQHVKRAVLPT